MKRLLVLLFVCFLASTAFVRVERVEAYFTSQEMSDFRKSYESQFSVGEFLPDAADQFAYSIAQVEQQFKDDPDVDFNQAKIYVMDGIPGQPKTGLIPFLAERYSDPVNEKRLLYKPLLDTAIFIKSATKTKQLEAAGVITKASSTEQFENAKNVLNKQFTSSMEAVRKSSSDEEKRKKCVTSSWGIPNFDLFACVDSVITGIIKGFAMQFAGFLVYLSANALNLAIDFGILQFARWSPESLYPIWIVIRQILSLCVVFAGLWLGFMYIVDKNNTKFRHYVPWVMIFALFINFSYPLVRGLTDISNVVSLNIYTATFGTEVLTNPLKSTRNAGSIILNQLGLTSLIDLALNTKVESSGFLDGIDSTPGAIMGVLFLFYAAFIFFMVTGILIMRTALLAFLIIGSPLLFIDSVIPKLGDVAMKLRTLFLQQLIVAPVFMFMLALTLKFLNVFKTGMTGFGTGTVQTMFSLFLMLVILDIMRRVTVATAGSLGNWAGNAMGKVGSYAIGAGVGAATGGAGLLARGTFGKAAARLRDSDWVKSRQDTVGGRMLHNFSNSVANSSFDARNSSLVQSGASKLGLSQGMGAGYKGGYDKEIKDKRAMYKSIPLTNRDGSFNRRGAEARINLAKDIVPGSTIKDYMGKDGAEKQAMFGAQKDQIAKDLMIARDQEEAEKVNAKIGEELVQGDIVRAQALKENIVVDKYNESTDNTERQTTYNTSTPEMQKTLQSQDHSRALEENTNRETERVAMKNKDHAQALKENATVDAYNASTSGGARRMAYNASTADVQKILQSQDHTRALEENAKREADRVISEANEKAKLTLESHADAQKRVDSMKLDDSKHKWEFA